MEPITFWDALLRLVVSGLLGAAIGYERQLHHHAAGFRTFTLICLASALAMIVSIFICQDNLGLHNGDPGRIAAQVVTGIGFIGAGLIMKGQDGIMGLTTAACIFMSAIIGLAAGAGLLLVSAVVTFIVVVLLWSSYFIKDYRKEEKNE